MANNQINALIIDDNRTFLITLKEIIKEYFPNIYCATSISFKTSIEKIKSNEYDFIISDNILHIGKTIDTEDTGFKIYQMLRKDGNNIPFILFSVDIIERLNDNDKNIYFISKASDFNNLLIKTINEIISKK
jgi:CheY-like chemotaxis protein